MLQKIISILSHFKMNGWIHSINLDKNYITIVIYKLPGMVGRRNQFTYSNYLVLAD